MTDDTLPSLEQGDLRFVLSRTPRDVREMVKKRGLVLGGGFVRATIAGEKPADIDLFGRSKEQLELSAKELAEERGGRVHETDNAFTVLAPPRMPVQFIHRWTYDDPKQVVNDFDFTIAKAVLYWVEKEDPENPGQTIGRWESQIAPTYYADLAGKRLVYCFPQRNEDAGGSILRVRKFLTQGYRIDVVHLGGVIARLIGALTYREPIHEIDERERAQVLAGLLREVDPLMVIDGVDLADTRHHG